VSAKLKTASEVFSTMAQEIDCNKAAGVTGDFMFELEGNNGGTWTVSLADGKCSVNSGPVANPNVTVKMTADDFVSLANGNLKAIPAFINGKIRVYGDYNMATKLQVLFNA
jgi:putative sterol carrier protein